MSVARVLAGFHIFLLTLRMAGERAPVVCQSHLQTSIGCNRNERRKRAERMVIVDTICADMDVGSLIVSYRRRRSGTARAVFEAVPLVDGKMAMVIRRYHMPHLCASTVVESRRQRENAAIPGSYVTHKCLRQALLRKRGCRVATEGRLRM
jgi:hypothetical protein